jgi:hypothetical protein
VGPVFVVEGLVLAERVEKPGPFTIRVRSRSSVPRKRVQGHAGPTAEIVVPDHEPEELTLSLLRRIEEIAGGRFRLTDTTA